MKDKLSDRNIQPNRVTIEINQSVNNRVKIEPVSIPFFVKDRDLRYINCNGSFLELLGMREEEVIGRRILEVEGPLGTNMDREIIEEGGNREFEVVVTSASGEQRHCLVTKSQLKDANNQVLGLIGIVRDITEERKQRIRIEKLMTLKDAMIEVTHAIMDNWSEEVLYKRILEMGVEAIENSDHGSVLMRGENDMFSPVAWVGYTDEAMHEFEVYLKDTFNWLATDGHEEQSVMINDITPYMTNWDLPDIAETADEAIIWASLCSPIMVNGEVVGLMNMDSSMKNAFTEIDMELVNYMSEQIEVALTKRTLYDKVHYLSKHDEMTGLLNRREFEAQTKKAVTHAQRNHDQLCLVVFDIDGLKGINDTYGHQMGDAFIETFAKSIKTIFREQDILGRYGGDEFVGVFRSRDLDWVKTRIEEVLLALKNNPIDVGDKQIPVRFSYGMACYPSDGHSYEKLVSIADQLMYAFKNNRL